MKEFELIAQLTASLASSERVIVGPGDDCAVVDLGLAEEHVLMKTDAVVEGIHFSSDEDPGRVGRKALARGLSDIAAMAGSPKHALVTLALPESHSVGAVKELYVGMERLAREFDVTIVGGETTTHPDRLLLSISLVGTVPRDRCVLRSGSLPGDALFVSGQLGGSLAGHHLDFTPRIMEAAWLAGQFDVHAMIDLSDGLAGDLPHLLRSRNLGAQLRRDSLPVSRAAKLQARENSMGRSAVAAALGDGEDYELLFTVASADAVAVLDAWKARFEKIPLTCIGKITEEPGIQLLTPEGLRPLGSHGYEHFQQP